MIYEQEGASMIVLWPLKVPPLAINVFIGLLTTDCKFGMGILYLPTMCFPLLLVWDSNAYMWWLL